MRYDQNVVFDPDVPKRAELSDVSTVTDPNLRVRGRRPEADAHIFATLGRQTSTERMSQKFARDPGGAKPNV